MIKPSISILQNDIDALLDHVKTDQFSRETLQSQIMHVLMETYNALNALDEARFKYDLSKIENDRSSLIPYFNHYKTLHDKALANNDTELAWRYALPIAIFQEFEKNHEKALGLLRIAIAGNIMHENDEIRAIHSAYFEKYDPQILQNSERNYANKEVILELYQQLAGYQVSHVKIVKSASLKLFNLFSTFTNIQKTKLAEHIGFIFSCLGEDISINAKRASRIKVIGEFHGMTLFDYQDNKKGQLYDFGLQQAFDKMLAQLVTSLKKDRNLAMVARINFNRKRMEATLFARLLS